MESGKINKRVVIEQPPTGQDAYGALTGSWTTYATVWASINPISAKTIELAKSIAPAVTHEVEIRYIAGLSAKTLMTYRLRFGTRIFSISGVINPNEKNEKLRLFCSEVN